MDAIEAQAALQGPLSLGDEALRAWVGLPPPLAAGGEEAARGAAPTYSLPQAQAYALGRMAASHAALAHVFEELAARLPGLRPRAMLDYGAGPGTAIWAAQEVSFGRLAARCEHLLSTSLLTRRHFMLLLDPLTGPHPCKCGRSCSAACVASWYLPGTHDCPSAYPPHRCGPRASRWHTLSSPRRTWRASAAASRRRDLPLITARRS